MAETKESARGTIILALVTLAIGVYVITYGLQTTFYFQARHWASSAPFLKETPQPLPSTATSPAQEKNLSFYGMNFSAPWKGIVSQKPGDAQSEVDFKAGPVIIFFNPTGEKDILSGIRDGDPKIYDKYEAVFGADLFPTNYDLYEAVYNASPASLSPVMTRSQVERIGTLLEWKMAFGGSGASAIYNVQANGLRGLQFGDTSRDPMVVLRLFDSHNAQYRLLFTSRAGTGTFAQSDVNCVLNSLQAPAGVH
jgi:hypothetical protein